MNLKTESNHKKLIQIANNRTYWKLKRLFDPFHGAARNMATDVELPSNITNGLLQARKKRFLSREISFYDPIQRSPKTTL